MRPSGDRVERERRERGAGRSGGFEREREMRVGCLASVDKARCGSVRWRGGDRWGPVGTGGGLGGDGAGTVV
jgi:hypothetical protein